MKKHKPRNDALLDAWSIVHLFSGVMAGWIVDPFIGLVILVLWEPFEIFLLSPLMNKFGITFGHETLRNSLSDIVFDTLGVLIGYYLLSNLITPPIHLF